MGIIMLPYRCRFCGIPILPKRALEGDSVCEAPSCGQLRVEERQPGGIRPITPEEFQARVRLQVGEPAGGYRGECS
jgi:hypothetical protein